MSTKHVDVLRDRYVDSVVQMSASRAMMEVDGVAWAAAAMGTPANLDTLGGRGFDAASVGAGANDLFLAVDAESDDAVQAALEAGRAALGGGSGAGGDGRGPAAGSAAERPRSLAEAVDSLGEAANLAIVSVPGDYAALEAHKALSAGLHVLLFSDNVSLEDEVALKERATELKKLVMGPGAGTAMLDGVGLGFANVVEKGRVGVAAAAGTGAQEAMSLLDRWGVGVSAVIGLGGRDLSDEVDGTMAKLAVTALRDDPGTDAILLVSKPPSERVARDVVGLAGDKPMVAALVGLADKIDVPAGVTVVTTLEEGVLETLKVLGIEAPDLAEGLADDVGGVCDRLSENRKLVRGLFSGGTLCYESLVILTRHVGPVWSNTPLDKKLKVPAPPGNHICLDLGEEEYTKGRPHPMIDPEARIELIREAGKEKDAAVILIDVVLGHGSHDDPAGQLAPVCGEVMDGGGPQVVAYVLGTDQDPQGFDRQRETLRKAGCLVAPTAARASLAAAAIALRKPDLVTAAP